MRPEAEAAALTAWRAGAGPYWMDLAGGRPEQVAAWLTALGLEAGLLDLLHLGDDDTRILPLGESVFFAYPVPPESDAGKPDHFRCLCLDRLVITMSAQSEGNSAPDESPLTKLRLPNGTTAGIVCALTLLHSGRLRRRAVALRREGDAAAERMDVDAEAVPIEQILSLKNRGLALGAILDEQLAVLEVLKAIDKPVLPLLRLADPFQIVVETTRAADRDIDRLDRRVSDLQQRYQSAQQDKLNRRVALLTVLTAIFMPLTLFTGIEGMNFENMPELHYRYAYPIALAGMASVAVGLYIYFRAQWRSGQ
jgi:Mg2+ and Co2+ transporter CorA